MASTRGVEVGEHAVTHAAVLFDSPAAFSEQIAPFVRRGVELDDAVIVVARPENAAPLRSALGAAADAVRWEDATAPRRNPGQTFVDLHDAVMALSAARPGRVRVVHEQVHDGRAAGEVRELLRYDALCNEALADSGASMLCPVDTTLADADLLRGVRQVHPHVIEDGHAAASASYVAPRQYVAAGDRADDLEPPPSYATKLAPADDASARRAVEAFARGFLPPTRVDDLVFAANELVANAEEHAGGLLHVLLWVDGATVVCEVADGGPGLADPTCGYRPPVDPLDRGRGLWLVRQLCDLVEVRSSELGTRFRLHVAA